MDQTFFSASPMKLNYGVTLRSVNKAVEIKACIIKKVEITKLYLVYAHVTIRVSNAE